MEQPQPTMSSNPRRVWLVRHGQTDWNRQRRYLSDTDAPLDTLGEQQAAALGRFFAAHRVDVVIHSPALRAAQTARSIIGNRHIQQVSEPRWREISHGRWEGLTYAEVVARFPEEASRRFADPLHGAPLGGESLQQAAARVREAWRDLGWMFADLRVVVVTHATPIQILLCDLFRVSLVEHWRWRIDAGSVTMVDCYPTTTILRYANRTFRLSS